MSELELLRPDWSAPANVHAAVTTRAGGVSQPPWDTFNLGTHVGDEPAQVAENRVRLLAALRGIAPAEEPQWLNQVHGTTVVEAEPDAQRRQHYLPAADAVFTARPHLPCVVMTADCLPVFFCDRQGRQVAVAHAGWRGLCAGVLEATLRKFPQPGDVIAWLGPAIGPSAFEVGEEVRVAFIGSHSEAAKYFVPSLNAGHWLADIYGLARLRLQGAGVSEIFGGGLCTLNDAGRFFSFRRDGQAGRMAAVIWRSGAAAL